MKNVLKWIYRAACFIIIAGAVFTFVRCLIHVKDDHSLESLGVDTTQMAPADNAAQVEEATQALIAEAEAQSVQENPTVVLYDNGDISPYHPYTTVTAAFGDIVNSVAAELTWYVDGEEVAHESQRLLVEGSTVSCNVEIDPTQEGADTAEVKLDVNLGDGNTMTSSTMVNVERVSSTEAEVLVRTEEIPVTAVRDTAIYEDADLTRQTESLGEGDSGLLLEYKKDATGMTAIRMQLHTGESGWVSAADVEISEENCTTEEDYSEEMKTEFVNSMGYDSTTDYLVWVNLYTQKVNVFKGYEGNWALTETFECATGKNTSPTSTGVFTYSVLQEKWDLGDTYVKPVLVYNGGEAITSRPYDASTHYITDTTMGKPVSGGSVRMREDDVEWMAENIPVGTMVVVY